MYKKLKDPIYGYIKIKSSTINDIVDTACFQRLRHIRQTSYAPLYSAALHNRFIHSIGVYHLGKIAFKALKASIDTDYKDVTNEMWDQLEKIFLLACLLHDVGHAPFSHSGEQFYLNHQGTEQEELFQRLKEFVNQEEFSNDMTYYHKSGGIAAPHEIMSVIISFDVFDKQFKNNFEKEFFARCITGYKKRNIDNIQTTIENCLISLLNSSIIDVDKLDYLIRDSYVTGYDSISIDYERLLNSICIKHIGDQLVFNKSALSVLENVIYAHDSERKWIQNHPIVLYEHFLIQYAIKSVNKYYSQKESVNIFCENCLLEIGNGKISLLCDDDIIFLIKNICPNELTKEYFARNFRRHPIWKSEAEYNTLFLRTLGEESLSKLEDQLERVENFLLEENNMPIINDSAIQKCNEKLKLIDESKVINPKDKQPQKKAYNSILKYMTCLKEYSKKSSIPFDYVLIRANHFKSGFQKEELLTTIVDFPNLQKQNQLKDVVTLLTATNSRKKFFYLYYKREQNDTNLDVGSLAHDICKQCLD